MLKLLRLALVDIWRLTKPYFTTKDMGVMSLKPFGSLKLQERWFAIGLFLAVVAIEFAQVWINVRLSFWNRDFFDSIQNKNYDAFKSLLMFFAIIVSVYIVIAVLQYVLEEVLKIRWRRWLTNRYMENWLKDSNHYRMLLLGGVADNPDQRITEDIRDFIETTVSLFLRVLSTVSTLISFTVILWNLSANFTFPGTDVKVPGFLFWAALLYAVVGTWIAHKIGGHLVALNFERQKYEADFRYSLVRVRENSEQIALIDGEKAERGNLNIRFNRMFSNFMEIVQRQKWLTAFTNGYGQFSVVWPYLVIAPYYFVTGTISLGQMTQTSGAFNRVESALSFFVNRYAILAVYKSTVDRLTGFGAALDKSEALGGAEKQINILPNAQAALEIKNLTLTLPQGQALVQADYLSFEKGKITLVTGPSGCGKSTMFRAIAGIWPYGKGEIGVPTGSSLMLLPQRPYMPMGSLAGAIAYPAARDRYSDAEIREALRAVHLPHLTERLEEEAPWGQVLSLGEQQRVALARALLAKPDWLFLDEATAALDEPTEAKVYQLLPQLLPQTSIVSIGHRSTLAAFHNARVEFSSLGNGQFAPHNVKLA